MRSAWIVLVLAACHHATPAAPTNTPVSIASTHAARPRAPRIAPIDLALGRPGAANAWHARIARYDVAWFVADEKITHDEAAIVDREVALADQTATDARALIEGDDARVCVWMRRDALWRVIARRTRVVVDGAPNGSDVGLTARGGAKVTAQHGDRVVLADDGLLAHGRVDVDAVGDAWPPEPPPPTLPDSAPMIDEHVAIRARPAHDGDVLATTTEPIAVRVIARRGDWIEIAAGGAHLEVDGFVPASSVQSSLGGYGLGETGSGYGISDTSEVDVPAGACLRDGEHGEIVGVETETRRRYAWEVSPDVWNVYVGLPWDLAQLWYRAGEMCGGHFPVKRGSRFSSSAAMPSAASALARLSAWASASISAAPRTSQSSPR
jgi:hypothetical protein